MSVEDQLDEIFDDEAPKNKPPMPSSFVIKDESTPTIHFEEKNNESFTV